MEKFSLLVELIYLVDIQKVVDVKDIYEVEKLIEWDTLEYILYGQTWIVDVIIKIH